MRLDDIDVQGAWRQVIDVRPLESHHIGNQAMLGAELAILLGGDGSAVMPAEGFQRVLDEIPGLRFGEAALGFGAFDQGQRGGGEDRALVERRLGECPQLRIFDQFQAQQRGEYPERADLQRLFMHGAKRGGVHRHPGRRQVVITHRLHAHHREQTGEGRQFCRRADTDRAMALQVQALDFAGAVQLPGHLRIAVQHMTVGLLHQFHQRAV